MLESYNTHTHTYKAQSQPNKTYFYQQVLANGLVKARNGSVYKLFPDFYHLTVANPRMHRQNLGFTDLRSFTVTHTHTHTYIYIYIYIYRVIRNDYRGFNNLSYTNALEIAVCSCTDESRNFHFPRQVREFLNQHLPQRWIGWHDTDSLERTGLSCRVSCRITNGAHIERL
jgi:hypothetical protein